jgi:HD-like signal output (HDOD) protein
MVIVAGAVIVCVVAGVLLYRSMKGTTPPAASPAAASRRPDIDTGRAPEVPLKARNAFRPEPLDESALPDGLREFHLLEADGLSEERRAELLVELRRIALPPRSLQELMAPDFLEEGSVRDLAELIMRDPLLAANVLGRVNSPFYGLQSPIVSVPHAITFLGKNAVRNMAIKFLTAQAFSTDDTELRRLYDRIWDAGMIASELCVLLSQKLGFSETGTASTQTVLSFIGDFAVLTLQSADGAKSAWEQGLFGRVQLQQESIGTNSLALGSLLLSEWGLPQEIVDGVGGMGRILVTPCRGEDSAREARLALGYACARIGEGIALRRLCEVEQIDFATMDGADFAYLRTYLALPEMARIGEHLQAPDIRNALSRMIIATNQ